MTATRCPISAAPATVAEPAVGAISVPRIRTVVVLPTAAVCQLGQLTQTTQS
jgi:hypothetical protein